jgi:tRNA-2-methylthio-N6-dimethylallyladenosine synthase
MEKTIEETKQGESLILEAKSTNTKKLYIESYGCSMNFSDSEIVASILSENGFNTTQILEEADLVLVNTCSIRDKAEQTVRKRLEKYNAVKKRVNPKMKVGVLGCMAERLKEQFLEQEKIVDLVVGRTLIRICPICSPKLMSRMPSTLFCPKKKPTAISHRFD